MKELEIKNDLNYFREFFEKLKKNNSYSRLGKTFQANKKYYYDLGTGKVLECTKNVYSILECLEKYNSFDSLLKLELKDNDLIDALNILKSTIERENIMKAPCVTEMTGVHKTQLEESIDRNLSQMTLELTQRCNLRCKYCIYQDENGKFRNFSESNDMSLNIAQKALDYAVNHAQDKDFYLTFYGGEPLLKFDLISQCVEYLKSKKMKNNIFYSTTTNLTLMTKEKAEYFASLSNFSVVCSIDGDEEIHDANRVTINNTGSHALAINGLKNLVEAYGRENVSQILINMVLTEPYTKEKFDRIQNFIDTCPYIFPEMTIMYSYADYGKTSDDETKLNLPNNKALEYWNPVQKWEQDKQDNNKSLFSTNNRHRSFLKVHNRELSNRPIKGYLFNACCIPASRKIYVTTNGDFQACEQMGQAPVIGNVFKGIDIDTIQQKFINEYENKSIPDCSQCWAIRLCNLCYARCYNNEGIDIKTKRVKCFHERRMVEHTLSEYHRLLEEDPGSLECLNNII